MLKLLMDKPGWTLALLISLLTCSADVMVAACAESHANKAAERGGAQAELVHDWRQRLSDADYEERERATEDLTQAGLDNVDLLVSLSVCDDLEVAWRARTATIAVFSQLSAEGRTDLLMRMQRRLTESPDLPVITKIEMQELIGSLRGRTADVLGRLAQLGVVLESSRDRTFIVNFRAKTIATDSLFADMGFVGPVTTINLLRLRISDNQLRYLKHLKHLERLYLKDTGLNGTGLKHLTGLEKLNSISLQGLKLQPEAFDALAQMKNLQYLGLDQTSTTDRDLAKLSGLKQMKQLWLNQTKVTDQGLAAAGNMESLEKLVLTDLAIDGSGLANLAVLKELKYLSLEGCPVDDAVVKQLKPLDSLETLGLDRTRVTDEAVAKIKEMKNLKVLWLAGTKITDRCIPDLLEMRNLERLLLFNCQISEREFQRLKAGLPNCAINELK